MTFQRNSAGTIDNPHQPRCDVISTTITMQSSSASLREPKNKTTAQGYRNNSHFTYTAAAEVCGRRWSTPECRRRRRHRRARRADCRFATSNKATCAQSSTIASASTADAVHNSPAYYVTRRHPSEHYGRTKRGVTDSRDDNACTRGNKQHRSVRLPNVPHGGRGVVKQQASGRSEKKCVAYSSTARRLHGARQKQHRQHRQHHQPTQHGRHSAAAAAARP